MLSVFFSFSNLGEWTPMTTRTPGYLASSLAISGRVWMQLMQHSVQKSTSTMRPLRSAAAMGRSVLSQSVPPMRSRRRPLACSPPASPLAKAASGDRGWAWPRPASASSVTTPSVGTAAGCTATRQAARPRQTAVRARQANRNGMGLVSWRGRLRIAGRAGGGPTLPRTAAPRSVYCTKHGTAMEPQPDDVSRATPRGAGYINMDATAWCRIQDDWTR